MKRLIKALSGLVVLVVVLLVVGVAILMSIDVNDYRGQIADVVRDATGRELEIQGDLRLEISLQPAIAVDGVLFANPAGMSRPHMATLKHAEARVALLPLLSGDIRVKYVVLEGLDVLAEVDADGRPNWQIGEAAPAADQAPSSPPTIPIVEEVRITDVRLAYRDARTGETHEVALERLNLKAEGADMPLALDMAGAYGGLPFEVSGTTASIASIAALASGDAPLPLDLTAKALGATVTLKGSVATLQQTPTFDLAVKVTGDSITATVKDAQSVVPALADLPMPVDGPYSLAATLRGPLDGLGVHDIAVSAGTTESLLVKAEGSLANAIAVEGLELSIAAQSAELAALVRAAQPLVPALADMEVPDLGPLDAKVKVAGSLADLKVPELSLNVGRSETVSILLTGKVTRPLAAQGLDLRFIVEGTDISSFEAVAGGPLPKIPPFRIEGRASDGDGAYGVDGLHIKIGDSVIGGWVTVTVEGPKPRIDAQILADLVDFKDIAPPIPPESPAQPAKPAPTRLFTDDPLPLDTLKGIDADVTFRAKRIVKDGLTINDFTIELSLEDGHLTVAPLKAVLASGTLDGTVDLDGSSGTAAALKADLTVKGVVVGQILRDMELTDWIEEVPLDTKIDLAGSGATAHALAKSLDGEIQITLGHGRINNKAVDFVGADMAMEAFRALNPMSDRQDFTVLDCAVVRFVVADGMAQAEKGVAAETDKITVVGSGLVNLDTEAIDFAVKPEAREGLGINLAGVASMLRVKGTLMEPAVSVDALETAKKALSVGAAIAIGGLSLLAEGLVGRASADPQPCQTALGIAPPPAKAPAAAPSKRQAVPALKVPTKEEGGIGGTLKGLGRSLFGR